MTQQYLLSKIEELEKKQKEQEKKQKEQDEKITYIEDMLKMLTDGTV